MVEAEKFGALLRATRKARKLPLGELAERANTGAKHLGRIERGEKHPSFDLIVDLAKALDVSPAVFFDFDQVEPDAKQLKAAIRQLLERQNTRDLLRVNQIMRAILS